jgi:hypothetical protein
LNIRGLSEGYVYQVIKKYLHEEGWSILGGQPPGGTDHIPVIEIKDPEHLGKGSKGSYKPDLVTFNKKLNRIELIELKPGYSRSDQLKLEEILANPLRLLSFRDELISRKIFSLDDSILAGVTIQGALGYAGSNPRPQKLLTTYLVKDDTVSVHVPVFTNLSDG